MKIFQCLILALLLTSVSACTPIVSGTTSNLSEDNFFIGDSAQGMLNSTETALLVHPQATLLSFQAPQPNLAPAYLLNYQEENSRIFVIDQMQAEGEITVGAIEGAKSAVSQPVALRDGVQAAYTQYQLDGATTSTLSWQEEGLSIMLSAGDVGLDEMIDFAQALVLQTR